MTIALYLALSAALLESITCPKNVNFAKVTKMVSYTVAKQQPNVGQAQAIGQHAARYACRKRLKLQ